ncbi:hypothetical protein HK097_009434 [Rhizophlyctis rosea]|uniref:Uncharacterized protein n=1 Tax=Rhizophlyctis rosea TaxID=64517 RepID=A0AAD5SAK0_9FUNG|nr:hypothetical protein HK097_009434 [Rhizophlyctis rosea]
MTQPPSPTARTTPFHLMAEVSPHPKAKTLAPFGRGKRDGAPPGVVGNDSDMGLEKQDDAAFIEPDLRATYEDIETAIFDIPAADSQLNPSQMPKAFQKGSRKADLKQPPSKQPSTSARLALELENNRLADDVKRCRVEIRDLKRELLEKSTQPAIPDVSALASLIPGGTGKAATEAKIIELAKKVII